MITIKRHKSSGTENLGNSNHNIQSAFYVIHPAALDLCVNKSLMFLQMMSSSKLCEGTKYTVIYHTLIHRSGKISAALFTFFIGI
jgi:hypothetical protein